MNENVELVECDDCHAVKPISEFRSPGHTAGGSCNGFDIDSCFCADCARRSYGELQEDLYQSAAAEMAAEEKAAGDCARRDSRQYIAPLVVGNRWAYWIEQLQPDGSARGFPLEFRNGVRAWRTDQIYIGDEQMTGTIVEVVTQLLLLLLQHLRHLLHPRLLLLYHSHNFHHRILPTHYLQVHAYGGNRGKLRIHLNRRRQKVNLLLQFSLQVPNPSKFQG